MQFPFSANKTGSRNFSLLPTVCTPPSSRLLHLQRKNWLIYGHDTALQDAYDGPDQFKLKNTVLQRSWARRGPCIPGREPPTADDVPQRPSKNGRAAGQRGCGAPAKGQGRLRLRSRYLGGRRGPRSAEQARSVPMHGRGSPEGSRELRLSLLTPAEGPQGWVQGSWGGGRR